MKKGMFVIVMLAAVLLIGGWILRSVTIYSPTQKEAVEHFLNIKTEEFVVVSQLDTSSLAFFTNSKGQLLVAYLKRGVFGFKVESVGNEPISLKKVATDRSIPFKTIFRPFAGTSIVYGLALSEKTGLILVKDVPAAYIPLETLSHEPKRRRRLWVTKFKKKLYWVINKLAN